jgi:CTP:phosphocholine cytidylyltransferase-like protein
MNILIPMAGLGSRFTDFGFTINKYLLPIDKDLTTMIEKAITSLNAPPSTHFILIIREEGFIDQPLRDLLNSICQQNNYKCTILSTNKVTEGPTCTAYLAKELINNDVPLIISNSDQILDWNYSKFIDRASTADGCVLTYTPTYELTIGQKDKHSFVKCNESGTPVRYIEKVAISTEALVGTHYYKHGRLFIEAAEYTFRNNIRAPNGEFYISLTYQALVDLGYTTCTYHLSSIENFYTVGETGDYFTYYNKDNAVVISRDVSQIVVLTNNKVSVTENNDVVHIPTISDDGLEIHANKYIINTGAIPGNKRDTLPFTSYVRGWLIGDFEPALIRSTDIEVGILSHKKGEKWPFHYHSEATEINLLISGEMKVNGITIRCGDIFVFNKNIISCPDFIDDCTVLCVKIPSRPKDKHII